jgi:hypothetical protein
MKTILFITRTKTLSGGGEKVFLDNLTSNKQFRYNYLSKMLCLEGNEKDCELRKKLILRGLESAENFNVKNYLRNLEEIYE